MANDDQSEAELGAGLYLVNVSEINLIRRLRQLQAGAHLVIIQADGMGIFGLTVLQGGKVEKLRKNAEQV